MAQTFTTIQTTIGNMIQDTSNKMNLLTTQYINDRYRDILRRTNWETLKEDYTFPTVGATQDYTLPTDFKKETYVYDVTSNNQLSRITMNEYVDRYITESSANPTKYVILDVMVAGERAKKVRMVPTPISAYTISMPYTLSPVDLSGTDYPIIPCEQALINGGTATALRYKRQFNKAADFEAMYERDLQTLMWDEVNQPNQVHKFKPVTFNNNDLY